MSGNLVARSGISERPVAHSLPLVACPDCAAIQRLPPPPGGRLHCCSCYGTLERTTGRSLDGALACALSTLLLLLPANIWPLLRVRDLGLDLTTHIGAAVPILWQEHRPILSLGVALQAVLLPFFRYGLLMAVLGALKFGANGAWIGPAFRWAEELDQWAMPDVFLIGLVIGYSRVAPYVPVHVGNGGLCLVGAAFLSMITRATLDRRTIWRWIRAPDEPPPGDRIGCTQCDLVLDARLDLERCPRCRARLSRRRPNALPVALALSLAALVLYPVANLYPMSVQNRLGSTHTHTIFTGVMDLVNAGLWPLAIVIFTVSIAIPLAKVLALFWCFLSVWRKSRNRLEWKTRIYRVVDHLGRWSNMDIYTIAVFMPLIQVRGLVQVRAGDGASAFLSIIVLTMFASRVFDPRLMWDATERRHE